MGYGPIVNGKQTPITPWKGSWAQSQEESRQWPIGVRHDAPLLKKAPERKSGK